ncbi:hypothetical protein LPJ56_006927, partial [Coemansia sp. RSA 2599]
LVGKVLLGAAGEKRQRRDRSKCSAVSGLAQKLYCAVHCFCCDRVPRDNCRPRSNL